MTSFSKRLFASALAFCFFAAASGASNTAIITYDIVVLNGRVIDPESKLDAVRNLAIAAGKIKNISRQVALSAPLSKANSKSGLRSTK